MSARQLRLKLILLSGVFGAGCGEDSNLAKDASAENDDMVVSDGGMPDAATDQEEEDAAEPVDASDDGVQPTGPRELELLVCDGPGASFATAIFDYGFGPGQNFGQEDLGRVFGPPQGAGCCSGSLDVVSLGLGGYIVLEFAGNAIVDGPGPDFIVFENVFGLGNDVNRPNAELATVAVSEDGIEWFDFPCTAEKAPAEGCAGWHVIYANPETNDIDPTDPQVAGGDAFDLADIGVSRARLVRITDRADIAGTVFDLDAVSIVNGECL